MAKRPRARNKGETPSLEMTPMIDVVFQLLIFFIVVVKQEDILARLVADRPAPSDERSRPEDEKPPEFLDIEISRDAVIFMRQVAAVDLRSLQRTPAVEPNYAKLDEHLAAQAKFGTDVTVTIRCTLNSPHGALVRVLDLCAKHKLTKLNIFSM